MRSLSDLAWRVVEAQHVVSTAKLVESQAEHVVLEQLIETHKPQLPKAEEFSGLHYLLATPFRYPPLRHGSRFGTRDERSLWYGSRELRASLAEVAYYRLLFLEGTEAKIEGLETGLTAFRASIRTRKGVDLTRPPFVEFTTRISSPSDYSESQTLGREMRADGVEVFRYRSARDRLGGTNVGMFTPRAFQIKKPIESQAWHCRATRSQVDLSRSDLLVTDRVHFPRDEFVVKGILPAPALRA